MLKLNIASGPSFHFSKTDNWLNIDHIDMWFHINFVNTNKTAYADYLKRQCDFVHKEGGELLFQKRNLHDLFPDYKDNSVGLIYFGQAIEHMNYIYQIPKLLKELYRIMEPNAVLRITTPDFDLLINHYLNGTMDTFNNDQPEIYKTLDPSAQLAMLCWGASGENCRIDNYEGHFFLYTKTSLTKVLNDAGFKNVMFYDKPGISYSEIMAKECTDQGVNHSLICEAVK
jgi:predicted SAM-dependent methyltransferase